MTHPLDRPIWSALTTRQAAFSEGDASAVRLRRDMGVFAATRDGSPEGLAALLPDHGGGLAVFEDEPVSAAPGLRVIEARTMCQMVLADPPHAIDDADIVQLNDADAPAMLALATLTRPGPFAIRTPDFGGFVGIKRDGVLVAMAGTRLAVPGFREVSGVCTHPNHRGGGLAAKLMARVAAAIRADGDEPLLHSFADNHGAIGLYERLGYRTRRLLTVSFLEAG